MKTKYKSRRYRNNNYNNKRKRKRSINRRPYLFYLIVIIIIVIGLCKMAPEVIEIKFVVSEQQEETIRQIVKEELINMKEQEAQLELDQPIVEEVNQVVEEQSQQPESISSRGGEREIQVEQKETLDNYRITSYHPGDGYQTSSKTGSGKTTANFNTMNINGKTVYTYQGKIVVAGATNALLKSGYSKNGSQSEQVKHYFNYYDTGKLLIDGQWYDFIVLDSCGASMWKGQYRLDIFVPSVSDIIDISSTQIILD